LIKKENTVLTVASSPAIQINISKKQLIALTVILLTTTTAATVNIRDTTNIFQQLNMNNNPITNLQNPNNPQDAATKNYVDNNAGSFSVGSYESKTSSSGTYTNSKNRPVMVVASFDIYTGSASASVNEVQVYSTGDTTSDEENSEISFVVPKGGSYTLSGDVITHTIVTVGNGSTGSERGLDWSTARQVKDSYEDGDYDKASVTCNTNEVLVEASCHKNYDSAGTDVLCDTRTERKAEIVDGDSTGESVWGTCVDKN
jgi:hypothetical protein